MWILLALACTPKASDDSAEGRDTALDSPVDSDTELLPCEGISAQVTDLSPEQLHTMLEDKDFQLINVHVPYAGEIEPTDAHVPYDDVDAIEQQLNGQLDARVVLYCRTGPMSLSAARALVQRGYCAVYDLPAGMVGWERDGYPLGD